MGLAASQARLLSITSRISDNELRAQLINNQKMRLSSESSQVSENYINALNKTNLVFANYDENDKAQNVPLTFNNLTAFNQYNNQYGLTNTAGNILISEKEAEIFKNCDGTSEDFLKKHGIEYTTSYWDTLQAQLETNESFYSNPDGDGVAEADGTTPAKFTASGKKIDNAYTDGHYDFFTSGELREMYEGNKDKNIPSYEEVIKTSQYTDFAGYVDSFAQQAAALKQAAAQKNQLIGVYANAALSAGETFNAINSLSSTPTASDITTINEKLKNDIGKYYDGVTYDANKMTISQDILKTFRQDGSKGYIAVDINAYFDDQKTTKLHSNGYDESALFITITDPLNPLGQKEYARVEDPSGNGQIVFADTTTGGTSNLYKWNGSSMQQYTYTEEDEQHNVQTITPTVKVNRNGSTVQFTCDEEDNNGNITNVTFQYPARTSNINDAKIEQVVPLSEYLDTIKSILKEAAVDIFASIGKDTNGARLKESTFVSSYNTQDDTGASVSKAFSDTEKKILLSQTAANANVDAVLENICSLVFGDGQKNKITNSDDMTDFLNIIMSGNLKNFMDGRQNIVLNNTGTPITITKDDLASNEIRNCVNAYIVDTMMDLFGEPVYGYMKKDATGHWVTAQEEATWYLNLFNKIQTCGYQMLPNGLASSTEWIQFALENGIVVMEQINSEAAWQPITYTSCSDIIEQNDKTAATIAEAEYNKAMRQIEAKDEMFDLELKNIDTEHSALESEYESVKKAMSGNIERTFQMYS